MLEKQNIEWKESWHDDYLKWVSAFANAEGGVLYIGKDDKGKVVGVSNYEKLLVNLPNKISNKLGVLCDINHHEEDGKHFIEIITKPYSNGISYNGKYYYRTGSTTQELKGNDLTEFLLKKTGKTWDDVIEPNATFDDIYEEGIEEFVKLAIASKRISEGAVGADKKTIFENLLLSENGNLKRAALILFGHKPLKFFASCFVKIGKFGKSDSDLQFQDVIEGNLFSLLDGTLEILFTKYIGSSITYEGIQRVETFEYPYKAVREVLLNALVHRVFYETPIQISVYDDKIMFWNPGMLPEPLKPKDLKVKHSSIARNPRIADVFFKAGFIETWGRGTINVIEECESAGLPEPKIEELTGGVAVTLFKDKANDEYLAKLDLNENQVKAVKYIRKNKYITNGIYQELYEVSDRSALRHLDELVQLGVLRKVGEKKGTRYEINQ